LSHRALRGKASKEFLVNPYRQRFLRPGPCVIAVRLPKAPGEYRLALTMLQESFAWFDDLDPSLRLMLTGRAANP